MAGTITDWIYQDSDPADVYVLLGRPVFDPNRGELLAAIRATARELIGFQNHRDSRVAERAVRLHSELGRAESIFSDSHQRHQYDNEIFDRIRVEFSKLSLDAQHWSADRIVDWLNREYHVHPDRVTVIAEALSSSDHGALVFDDSVDDETKHDSGTHDEPAATVVADPQREATRRPRKLRAFGAPNLPSRARPHESATSPGTSVPNLKRAKPTPVEIGKARGTAAPADRKGQPQRSYLPPRPAAPVIDATKRVANTAERPVDRSAVRSRMFLFAAISTVSVALLVVIGIVIWSTSRSNQAAVELDNGKVKNDDPVIDLVVPIETAPRNETAEPPTVAASPTVGALVDYTGTLEYIRGMRYQPTAGQPVTEMHVVLKLDERVGQDIDFLEAYVQDERLARELLDYVTKEEAKELTDESAEVDQVRIAGTVVTARTPIFRFHVKSPAIHIRLIRMQRVDEPDSRVVAAGPAREESSYRQPPETYSILGMLRLNPAPREVVKFKGIFRRFDPKYQTALVVPENMSESERGVHAHAPWLDFAEYTPGEAVEVEGMGTGKAFTKNGQPIISATKFHRAGVDERPPDQPDQTDQPQPNVQAPIANLNRKHPGTDLLVVSEDGPTAAIQSQGEWTLLDLSDKSPSKIIWSFVDHVGRVWLAGETSGSGALTVLDGNSIQTYTSADGLPEKPLAHVCEDSQDAIWVSSWDGGVARYAANRWRTYTESDGLRHLTSNGCAEAADGRIWISGGTFGPVQPSISTFFQDALEKGGPAARLALTVMSIDGDKNGSIYLGCIGGLVIVRSDLTLVQITVDQGLPQKTPQATFVDSRGHIWLGTWGGGVAQVDPKTLQIQEDSIFADAKFVRRITEDAAGAIWVASLNGLWRYEAGRWSGPIETPLGTDRIRVAATVPTTVAKQLVQWAKAPDPVNPAPPSANPPPATPSAPEAIPQPETLLTRRPRSPYKFLKVFSPLWNRVTTIKLGATRNEMIVAMGPPAITFTIEFEKIGNRTADIYTTEGGRQGRFQTAHMSLIVSNSDGEIEYLDLAKVIKRTTTDDAVAAVTNAMLSLVAGYYKEAK